MPIPEDGFEKDNVILFGKGPAGMQQPLYARGVASSKYMQHVQAG